VLRRRVAFLLRPRARSGRFSFDSGQLHGLLSPSRPATSTLRPAASGLCVWLWFWGAAEPALPSGSFQTRAEVRTMASGAQPFRTTPHRTPPRVRVATPPPPNPSSAAAEMPWQLATCGHRFALRAYGRWCGTCLCGGHALSWWHCGSAADVAHSSSRRCSRVQTSPEVWPEGPDYLQGRVAAWPSQHLHAV